MEQLELNRSDLAKTLGGWSHVSQVLTRTGNSRLKTMRSFGKHLAIPTGSLLAYAVDGVSRVDQRMVSEGCSRSIPGDFVAGLRN
jgi:hypothetical protein